MKQLILIILLIIIIIIIIINRNEDNNLNTISNCEIVISRYNENLDWLKDDPFNKYPVHLYNKGVNNNFYHSPNIKDITKLKNVGREAHTYLYHIIKNYYNLSNITIFLPGSNDMFQKYNKSKFLINEIERHNNTVFVGAYYPDVKENLYNFEIDNYHSTNLNNYKLNAEKDLEMSKIRPFGKWFDYNFPNIKSNFISLYGIIGISKEDIIKHPLSYYENLIKELENHSNPEVGHYFERSYHAIFYPYNNAKYVSNLYELFYKIFKYGIF